MVAHPARFRKEEFTMWQLPRLRPDEILIYLRKSRTDDPALTVQEVLSKHEQMLGDWIDRNLPGMGPVPECNRFREVVSGETIDARPEIQRLLRLIESPRYKAVLIVEPQRLSRGDLEDIGRLVKILRYTSTLAITLQYTYDLSDERDRDMFERELKRGNEFLEYQKRIMGNGRLLSVQNGNFIGQHPPYGYRKTVIREGKRRCHTLEPVPEEAQVVRQVFELYAQGVNSCEIARTLNGMGIPSPAGKAWTASSIKPMVTNDHYIGMVHWNKRKTVKVIEGGELQYTRPRNRDPLVYPGKHPPIIDRELWDRVQDLRGKRPPVKPKTKYSNIFSGLVRCRDCGRVMYRQQTGSALPRLVCPNQARCDNGSCTIEEMAQEVVQALRCAIADLDLELDRGEADAARLQEQLAAQLERRLDELDAKELSMWDSYTSGAMPQSVFDKLKARLDDDRTAARESLTAARSAIPDRSSIQTRRTTLHAALDLLLDPNPPIRETNLLLKQCIESITYSRRRKQSTNRRYGTPTPLELDITLRI